ncbi:YetF domain-containing protein [Bradyrhizobium sp. AUGA SZCCT0222]|uniref:DUF421 domain-containing protein n=1 Tax=Bradyrhizobium sp. AUGA SZCCT0222 TaxID=2807668 RepID=UPI0032DE3176
MEKLFAVDWAELVIPTHSIGEMLVRGTVTYLALFLILRFVMKRQTSTIGIADILVVVVIADAAQNAFSREYKSITEGLVLVLTIVFWDFALNYLSYRYKPFAHLLAPTPMLLIKDGDMIKRNMRKEFITDDELSSELRQQGVEDARDVKAAWLEGNGEISVIRNDKEDAPKRRRQPVA